MMIQTIGAFIGVVAVAVTFGVPRKFLVYSGLAGAVGWLVYLLLKKADWSEVISMFFAAMMVSLISHSFARILKAPVTLFLIPGIIPLVPGVAMYRIVYHLITNNSGLVNYYFREAILIAGMIALAIFIMDTIFRIFQKK